MWYRYGVLSDIRLALRVLRREPAHAWLAVVTIGLGVGATAALAAITYAILLKPLPWPDADRLVRVVETRDGRTPRVRWTLTNGSYLAWKDAPGTIESIGQWMIRPTTLDDGSEPLRLDLASVTPSVLPMLRAQPLLGRTFVEEDAPSGSAAAAKDLVILSHGLWLERFAADPRVVGRTVRLGDKPVEVIGVMPRAFVFPDRRVRAWAPLAIGAVQNQDGTLRLSIFPAMARLRPGATMAQAEAEGTARARSAPDPGMAAVALLGSKAPPDIRVVRANDALTADIRPALLTIVAAVGLLLLAGMANVANIQLARLLSRRREVGIRAALGASAARVLRQVVVESVTLNLAGGMAGVLVAVAIVAAAPALLPADFPRVSDVVLDPIVAVIAVGLSLFCGVMVGLVTAVQLRTPALTALLSSGGAVVESGGRRTMPARLRAAMMIVQVAISCVLLVGASLLLRSFAAMTTADRGYDASQLLTAQVMMPATSFSPQRRLATVGTLLERFATLPGVSTAAFASGLPLMAGSGGNLGFTLRSPDGHDHEVQAALRFVSPGYLDAMRIDLLEGRAFTAADGPDAQPVAMVNRAFARRYLDDRALGFTLPQNRGTIVGVVDDVKQRGVSEPPDVEILLPYLQGRHASDATFVLRTAGDPIALAPALRSIVHETERSLAIDTIVTMEDRVSASLARPRLAALLVGGFAGLSLLTAAAGLFGVLSYSVAQRTREIGLRTALGARPADIVRLVVGQAIGVTGVGLLAGLVAAAWASSLAASSLYGVSGTDAMTFAVVPLVLLIAAAVSALLPARRAARIDPLAALKQ